MTMDWAAFDAKQRARWDERHGSVTPRCPNGRPPACATENSLCTFPECATEPLGTFSNEAHDA